jgi:hypothetical protein
VRSKTPPSGCPSGRKVGTFRSILTSSPPLRNQAQTGKDRAWQSTPTPDRWSVGLGCPFTGMGEGNNSPVGAEGATRLTGLNHGARLREESRRTQRECGALGEIYSYEETESNGMLLFHDRDDPHSLGIKSLQDLRLSAWASSGRSHNLGRWTP